MQDATMNEVAAQAAVNTSRVLSERRRRFRPQVLQDDEGGYAVRRTVPLTDATAGGPPLKVLRGSGQPRTRRRLVEHRQQAIARASGRQGPGNGAHGGGWERNQQRLACL